MSLRLRLVLSYVLIVALCLIITAVTLSVVFQGFRDRALMTYLDGMTRPIYIQIVSLLQGKSSLAESWTNLQDMAQKNRIYIIFVDKNGSVIRQASPESGSGQLNVPKGLPHDMAEATHGTFITASGQKFVYAAYPIGRTPGVQLLSRSESLVLCVPRSSLAFVWAGLLSTFLLVIPVALGVSVLMAIFLSRSVYRPVRRLEQAAENLAQGRYDQEIPIEGPEEIRGLAISFNHMAKKVKESQQQMRHFVADVSHQLRTPLTSIQGFAQAMLDGTAGDNEAKLKANQIIVDESKRMVRQVNELLELSRMQAGQVKMAREPVNIKELLSHSQEIFALRAEEKGIKFKNTVESVGPVTGDIDRLEDVFNNLLDNAIKNTPPQGEVSISARHSHDSYVEICVADSGPGIPPEQLPYVFNRFQQTGGLRSGFGLGLAIAREIVLAHGGKIEASSEPGEGARFTITLPA